MLQIIAQPTAATTNFHFDDSDDDSKKDNYPRSILRMNIAIFDWDDTLFPTFAKCKKQHDFSLAELHQHGVIMYQTLCRYVELCGRQNVYIVTNGGKGWVRNSLTSIAYEYSHKLHQALQRTHNVLDQAIKQNPFEMLHRLLFDQEFSFPIVVMSAQHFYKTLHPHQTLPVDPTQWKLFTFKCLLDSKLKRIDHNQCLVDLQILSVGDGPAEYHASMSTKKYVQDSWEHLITRVSCHRAKLAHNPSMNTMHKQLKTIRDLIPHCFADGAAELNLDTCKQ
eukprot:CAMPEP_0202726644 /NCGR_PEP_ID=MMETSP1385-20130828/184718_1 /ASSEMBLY_ACC=CAM_ASM_000861 /TAXON_ID=933848 /ORGANISM="Elphidium margaritaceum" /LENGTH=278 /DNA_ID=CAMNT_0049392869 /DNA_START=83 /DNA_END=919 /DNA_ORIENTATION=+